MGQAPGQQYYRDSYDSIPHKEHLTLTDHIRAGFQPMGQQLSYLRDQAAKRKAQYDAEQRAKKNAASSPSDADGDGE